MQYFTPLLNNSRKTELRRLPGFRQFLISLGAAGPFALLIACILPALGQTHTPQGLSCTIVDTAPKLVRLEGIAELTSDVVLECQGGTPTPAGQPIPTVTFRAFINTGLI